MHGSPLSSWDNRLLWKYFDYHEIGIIGEPYFDINFNEVMYLTDTGRRWDGDSVSVRDKPNGSEIDAREQELFRNWKVRPKIINDQIDICNIKFPKCHSTYDIMKYSEEGRMPNTMMMTFHPQRWTNSIIPWVKELMWQNSKNIGKFFLIKLKT